MKPRRFVSRICLLFVATVLSLGVLAGPAGAHSLESSTVSIRQGDATVEATISVAVETLEEAMGTTDPTADEIVAYLDEHLTLTGADGVEWPDTFSGAVFEDVEGIESFSVDVEFDSGDASTAEFTVAYDAVVEAVPGHEAVVVLTDVDGDVSTPGVIDAAGGTLTIGGSTTGVAVVDMVEYGFHHVLEGADHLLFLTTLLLPAPLLAAGGRWQRRSDTGATIRQVAHVITAFTIGHSLTLVASSLGWISAPTQPVEILVAASVGVSAVHAIRPIARRGEQWIAAGFGLVHGLAFAGILTDLGLEGRTSLTALAAFNVGVELAQLAAAALVFPSLLLLARTRSYPAVRIAGAGAALVAAAAWIVERLELAANPFTPIEGAVIAHPWRIVVGLAVAAVAIAVLDRRPAGDARHLERREPTPDHARL